jgi:hypothetical protein
LVCSLLWGIVNAFEYAVEEGASTPARCSTTSIYFVLVPGASPNHSDIACVYWYVKALAVACAGLLIFLAHDSAGGTALWRSKAGGLLCGLLVLAVYGAATAGSLAHDTNLLPAAEALIHSVKAAFAATVLLTLWRHHRRGASLLGRSEAQPVRWAVRMRPPALWYALLAISSAVCIAGSWALVWRQEAVGFCLGFVSEGAYTFFGLLIYLVHSPGARIARVGVEQPHPQLESALSSRA